MLQTLMHHTGLAVIPVPMPIFMGVQKQHKGRLPTRPICCGWQAVELTLGLSEADLARSEEASFAQLGGDSLAAIQFARGIDDLCGVPLPVSFVLDHSNSLAAITAKARAGCMGAMELCWRLTESLINMLRVHFPSSLSSI